MARCSFATRMILCCSSSCFTLGLWDGNTDRIEIEGNGHFHVDPEDGPQVHHWAELLYKIPLTPLTLVLDLVTSPVQAVIYSSSDDCLLAQD